MIADRQALVAAFRSLVQERLAALDEAGAAARAGTRVDGSHRPANRGERAAVTTQGYLAHGLAERAAQLAEDLRLLDQVPLEPTDRVRAGALVEVEEPDGARCRYILLPGGAGDRLPDAQGQVTVISPTSPLARALRDREAGDLVRLRRGGQEVELELCRVA